MNKWTLVVALIIIAVVCLLGFYAASNNKMIVPKSVHLLPFPKTISSTTQIIPSNASTSAIVGNSVSSDLPAQIAQNYFNEFSECMKNPPASASGQVSIYCQTHNQHVGKALANNLTKEYAPVICGQNPPQSIAVTVTPIIDNNKATVILSEQFGINNTTDVTYKLQQEEDIWKVENIICP